MVQRPEPRERARWLDIAWKQASPLGSYSLDTLPSAADAWEAFKAVKEVRNLQADSISGRRQC